VFIFETHNFYTHSCRSVMCWYCTSYSGVQYIISVKDSEANMLGSALASTTYGM